MNCNLNQSDEKSDQPGILGLDDPTFEQHIANQTTKQTELAFWTNNNEILFE